MRPVFLFFIASSCCSFVKHTKEKQSSPGVLEFIEGNRGIKSRKKLGFIDL